jgi:hypothetical protein
MRPHRDPDASDHDDPGRRVPISESAPDEDDAPAPTGLPPEQRRRGQTVDDEPETQETG